ncbi:unnamed protein product [Rodentolepis nana]|uniref:PHD-type domain-containing protein n=1 Tax=Rodentolepis nana TaxID=102285 RepID=A0A0R3TEJ9_RODNA|nr:unnamed protein product [Rodentolepis nana]
MNGQSDVLSVSTSDKKVNHIFIPSQSGKDRISTNPTQVRKPADKYFITRSILKNGDEGYFVPSGTSVSTLKSDLKYMVSDDCRDDMQDFELTNLEYDAKQQNVYLLSDNSKENHHGILNSNKLQNVDFKLIQSRKKRLIENSETNGLLPLSKRRKIMDDLTNVFTLDLPTMNLPDIKEKDFKTTTISRMAKTEYFKCPQIAKIEEWFDDNEDVSGNEYNPIPKGRFFSPFPLPMINSNKSIVEEIDRCLACDMNSEMSYSEDFYSPDIKRYRRISTLHSPVSQVDGPISSIPRVIENENETTTPVCGNIENNYPDAKADRHERTLSSTNAIKRSLTEEFIRVPCKGTAHSSDQCSSFTGKLQSFRKGSKTKIQRYDYPYCAAKICLTPVGASIDWICCDTCEKWYHQICLRLKTLPKGHYECPSCSKAKNK